VAEASFLHQGSFGHKGVDAGIGRPEGLAEDKYENHGGVRPVTSVLGDAFPRVAIGRWPPVLVLPTIPTAAEVAAWLGTPGDLEGVVVYQDPPYLGTTGYQSDIPRADVIATALDFAALGAVVCVSEAEPLADLTGRGWHVAEITEGRKGQKRTFSAQKREYLTMSREPVHRVATQVGMFTKEAV